MVMVKPKRNVDLVKITKSEAKMLYDKYLHVFLTPAELRINFESSKSFTVNKSIDKEDFDKLVNISNRFWYSEETGKSINFFCTQYVYDRMIGKNRTNCFKDEMIFSLKEYGRDETLLLSLGDGSNLLAEDEKEGYIGYINWYAVNGIYENYDDADEAVIEGKEIDGGMVMITETMLDDSLCSLQDAFVSDFLKNVIEDYLITLPLEKEV